MSDRLDYATPSPRRSRLRGPATVLGTLLLGATFFVVIGWWVGRINVASRVAITIPSTPAPPPPRTIPPPTPIVLPSDPTIIRLRQRGVTQLPGGLRTPYLWMGVITDESVLVTVSDDKDWRVSRSMGEGDTISFSHLGTTYYLTLKEFTNPMAKDEASFELSPEPPPATRKAVP